MSRWINQSKNPSSGQSINNSAAQSDNPSSNQFDYSSHDQTINQTINQFILHACDPHEGLPLHERKSQSFYQSIKQSIKQSSNQSNNQQVFSLIELIDWIIENHWANNRQESLQLIDRLLAHQAIQAVSPSSNLSINQFHDSSEFRWINQSINQSVHHSSRQSKQWRLPTDVLLYSIINSVPGGSEALQAINQCTSQTFNQSIKLLRAAVIKVLNDQSINQTTNQPWKLIKQSKNFKRYTKEKIYVKNRTNNQSSNQPISQSITEHIAIPAAKRSKQSLSQSSYQSNDSDDFLAINQSNNDSFDQPLSQSKNQSMDESLNHSRTYHSHLTKTVSNLSIDRSINRSVNQSINQTINQYLSQLMDVRTRKRCDPMISSGRLVERLIDQTTGIYYYATDAPYQSHNQSPSGSKSQSIKQSIDQSINQPRDMIVLQDYFVDDRGAHIFYELSVRHNDAPINQSVNPSSHQSKDQARPTAQHVYERAEVLCSIRRLRPINHSSSQAINPLTDQLINQPINQCELTMITQIEYTGSSVKAESMRQALISRSMHQSVNQPSHQSHFPSAYQFVSDSNDQLINQSIDEIIPFWLIDQWAGHPSAPSINQASDQAINQCFSLSQSASLPNSMMNQSINRSINHSIHASLTHQSLNQPINPSILQPTDQLINQIHQQSVSDTASQSDHQPLHQLLSNPTADQSLNRSVDQSIHHSINQSVNLADLIPLSVIGRGAYSKILQVIDQHSGLMYAMKVVRKINQNQSSVNQSINQLIDPLTGQMNNLSINQSNAHYQYNNQLYNQPTNQPNTQAISVEEARLLNETIILSKLTEFYYFSQSVNQPNNQSNQQVYRPINQSNHCCHLIAAYQSTNRFYLLMPYCAGGDLFSLIRRQSFSEGHIALLASGLCYCLRTLHSLGIWHRDLKPENVLIDADGQVCLVDFGLSCLVDSLVNEQDQYHQSTNQSNNPYNYNQSTNQAPHHNRSNSQSQSPPRSYSVSGTSEYLSPEQLSGVGHDHMTDWWQFGVVLTEMLTGKHPFYHRNVYRLQQNILNRDPSLDGPPISPEARDLLEKLLTKDPLYRLGAVYGDIECHPFFAKHGIDWNKVARREQQPCFVPQLSSPSDVTHFDAEFTIQTPTDTPDINYSQTINPTNHQSINQLNHQFHNQLNNQTNSSMGHIKSPLNNQVINPPLNQPIEASPHQAPVNTAGGYAFYMRPANNQSTSQSTDQINNPSKPVSQLTQQLRNKALAGNN